MSKILKITNGDYKVKTGYAGTITLDTGDQIGTVVVTGNLVVLGDNTIVESETMNIKDNTIELNVGEYGPGITIKPDSTKSSGLIIHRGSGTDTNGVASSDVQIIYDESVLHYDPATASNKYGTVLFKYVDNRLLGIRTNSIDTNGANLGLINKGNGYITVTGTSNYERHALDYTAWDLAGNPRGTVAVGVTTVLDPDVIPNIQAVSDYVDSSLYFYRTPIIAEGDTTVITYDDSVSGGSSRIVFTVNNTEKGQFNDNGLNVDNVRLLTNTVSNTSANNLILTAPTSNTVEIDGVLQLDDTTGPAAVSGSTKIYTLDSSNTGPGKTGVYFTSYGNSDELVSKKRAILFSMIF